MNNLNQTDTIKSSFTSDFIPSERSSKIRSFDCAICCESLEKPGPPLESFTFGKLLLNASQLSYAERELIYREFSINDPCFIRGLYDCSKVLITGHCGHLFHSGCLREWFFMRRLDRQGKCPFCGQRSSYADCFIVHGITCGSYEVDDSDEDDFKGIVPKIPLDYSDISCVSSTWSNSDDEDTFSDDSGFDTSQINENGVDEETSVENQGVITKTTEDLSSFRKIRRFIHEFNLYYFPILILLTWIVSQSFRHRLEKHIIVMDNYEEDEDFETYGSEMIPLGYPFIAQMILVWTLFYKIEKLIVCIQN